MEKSAVLRMQSELVSVTWVLCTASCRYSSGEDRWPIGCLFPALTNKCQAVVAKAAQRVQQESNSEPANRQQSNLTANQVRSLAIIIEVATVLCLVYWLSFRNL